MSKLLVHLEDTTDGLLSPSPANFQSWAVAIDTLLSRAASICLRLVNESEMVQLNETYRGKTGATNVLAFSAEPMVDLRSEKDAGQEDEIPSDLMDGFLGDIAICADVVEQERLAQEKSSDAHWAHLFIHGVLHLLGYDHQSDEEAEQMESLEIELMRGLNFPAPYEAN